VLQGCYRSATSVLQEYYRNVTGTIAFGEDVVLESEGETLLAD
jgi:hypothetical protein